MKTRISNIFMVHEFQILVAKNHKSNKQQKTDIETALQYENEKY